MESIIIKKASKNDIPIILGLLYELGRPRPQNNSQAEQFENKVKKYLSDPDKQIFVAKLDGNVVGVVSIIFLSRLNQKTLEMYIPELVVAKNYRDKGIGKIIIEYCIELAKKKKCHRIRLESGNQRIASHKFYQKMGFEQTSLSFAKNIS